MGKRLSSRGMQVNLKRLESQGLIEKVALNHKQIVANLTRARKDLIMAKIKANVLIARLFVVS